MRRWLWATGFLGAALFASAHAGADQIVMRSGGRIEGVVVQQTASAVVVDTSPGRLTLPMSRVASIIRGRSALDTWRERSGSLHARDVQGWAALARWADQTGLSTQEAEAWQRVLAADPRNVEANRELGRVQVDGAWLPEPEAYRARGYVQFDGRWVSPAEHESLVRERAAEEAANQQRHEAGIRVREAEARAREAEARAREAEAAGSLPIGDDNGIPFWYAYGGGYGPVYGYGGYGYGAYGYGGGYRGRANAAPRPPFAGGHDRTPGARGPVGGVRPSSLGGRRPAPAPGAAAPIVGPPLGR